MKPFLGVPRLAIVVISLSVVFLSLVLAVVFLSAQPTESQGFVAPLATRTRGPTTTPPFPPPTAPTVRNVTPDRTLTAMPRPTATALPPAFTPLPSVPAVPRGGLWSENVVFGNPTPLGDNLKDPYGHVEWSPIGNQLAISLPTGEWIHTEKGSWEITWITLVDRTTHSVTRLARGSFPHWSPDGSHIAYQVWFPEIDEGYLRIIAVNTRHVVDATVFRAGDESTVPAWLSNTELAFYKGEAVVFDLRTNQTRRLLGANVLAEPRREPRPRFFTALPAKNAFAVAAGANIYLLEWANGEARLIRRIDEPLDHVDMAFSPDGKLFAFAPRGTLKIVGVYDPDVNIVLPHMRYAPFIGNWSPDGASLFYDDDDSTKIINRDGSGLAKVSVPHPVGLVRQCGLLTGTKYFGSNRMIGYSPQQ